MNEREFNKEKENIIFLINRLLNNNIINKGEEKDLKHLLKIINEYTYENRLSIKGKMRYYILDNLNISNHTLWEKCVRFDNKII